MSLLNLTPPSIGQPNATEDVDVVNAFSAIQTLINGNLDEPNFTTGFLQRVGLNGSGTIGRGAANIAATESRTNVAYGTLTTPDQVSGVVLPTNGLLIIGYQAAWQSTVANGGAAAIFIGANQAKLANTAVAPAVQEAFSGATINSDFPLASFGGGLATGNVGGYTGDVTTGQILGLGAPVNITPAAVTALGAGPCFIFAAAGTYTVSVQFRAGTGTVTAKNRRLWVLALGF